MPAPLRRWAWDFCLQKKDLREGKFIPPGNLHAAATAKFCGVLHSCQHFLEICLIVNIP